ncbi:syntaxin-18 [Sitodiplosis mosellana]|uniref:syntaxin-18 n=1 Tax=Sitodiplosis mosellana TaxID=263140 RepID=UPI00244488F9|nr:syntaxin-18 [Sitodiplosis mosellana]
MDLTQLFKASVKTVRLRNKSATFTDKTRILKHKSRDEFSIKANDIRYQITQLRDLLFENRSAYMRFGIHLKSSTQMSDVERNIIDEESDKIVSLCNKYLNDLKAECLKDRVRSKRQVVEHQLAIIDLLSGFLKDISRMHNEQKEIRIQHELETYKLLKLESNICVMRHTNKNTKKNDVNFDQSQIASITRRKQNKSDSEKEPYAKSKNIKTLNTSQSDVAIDEDQGDKFASSYDNVSSDDIQMLESENIQLLNDIRGISDEVDRIGENVVRIAKLQNEFTEKVTVQKDDIERIGNVVVGTTENIKDANEQIKQAIQRNAGLRVWVLFFLIVMSFALLFLDWYND